MVGKFAAPVTCDGVEIAILMVTETTQDAPAPIQTRVERAGQRIDPRRQSDGASVLDDLHHGRDFREC